MSEDVGEDCLILSPGVGFQGGKASYNLKNVIYTASRSIIFSKNPLNSFLSLKNNVSEVGHKSLSLKEKIEITIPNRIKYFDEKDFNMYPIKK